MTLLLLFACSGFSDSAAVCDPTLAGVAATSDGTKVQVVGTLLSVCSYPRVDLGPWSAATTASTSGQSFTVDVPLTDLDAAASGEAVPAGSACGEWSVDSDGVVTMPLTAWRYDGASDCPGDATFAGATGSADSLTFFAGGLGWLPLADSVGLPITFEGPAAAAGTTLTWTAKGGSVSGGSSALFASDDCPSGEAPCSLATAIVAGDGKSATVTVEVATPTGSGSGTIAAYGPPTFTTSGSAVVPGDSVMVTATHPAGLPTTSASGTLAYTWDTVTGTYTVSAGVDTPTDATLTITAKDAYGQTAATTVSRGTLVTGLTLSASASAVPASLTPSPVLLTATSAVSGAGAAVTWTVSGGTISPTSDGLADVAGVPTATAMLTPDPTAATVVVGVASGTAAAQVSLPVVDPPSVLVDRTSLTRGSDSVVTGTLASDVGLDRYTGADCVAEGSLSGNTSGSFTVSPWTNEASTCTVTVYDVLGQATSTTITLVPDVEDLAFSGLPDWVPDDGTTAATFDLSAAASAVGGTVTLSAGSGTFSPSTLTLATVADAAAASGTFRSSTAGNVTLVASSGAEVATADLVVAAPPDASETSMELEADTTAKLLFHSAGTLASCGYSGGTLTIEDDAGDPVVFPTSLGATLTLELAAPTGDATVWCQDSYGYRTSVPVSLGS